MRVRRYFGDIGASELAAAIGAHPHKSPRSVWAQRNMDPKEVIVSRFTQKLYDHGHKMEPLIADALKPLFLPGSIHPCGVYQRELTWNESHYFVTATPDRIATMIVSDGKGGRTNKTVLIECKASAPVKGVDTMPTAALKLYDIPQIQAQMYCTETDTCFYARHNGLNEIAVYDCRFDAELWKKIDAATVRFLDLANANALPQRKEPGLTALWRKELEEYSKNHTRLVYQVGLCLGTF